MALLSLFLVLLQASYQIVYYHFFHPLARFPGPFWESVTRLWTAYYSLMKREHMACGEQCRKYGPIVRITPTMLEVSRSSALPIIFNRYADKAKTYITGAFGDEPDSSFNSRHWRDHAQIRRFLNGAYSFSNINKMEPLIDNLIQEWIDKIAADFASKEKAIDFAAWAKYLSYDVIAELGFGDSFGCIKTGSDVGGFAQAFERDAPFFGLMGCLYPFTTWIKKTWFGKRYLVAKAEDKSGWGTFMALRDRLIDRRKADIEGGTYNGRVDLLQTLLNSRTEKGQPLDPQYVKAETFTTLIAGGDTTGTAMQSLVHFIMKDDSVYDKVMSEIDGATRAGQLSALPKYEEVSRYCPYYVACVKEALRLIPSIPNNFARLAPPEGLTIEGMYIPGGAEVACNPWILGRDEALYGPDACTFRPERWLESEEQTALYERYSLVFGYGTRSCLGKDIALMEIYKGPLQFFRQFRVQLEKEGTVTFKGSIHFWHDYWIRVTPRAQITAG